MLVLLQITRSNESIWLTRPSRILLYIIACSWFSTGEWPHHFIHRCALRAAGENVGNYAIYKNTIANTNYNISYTGANFSITQLGVTVTANTGQTKVYGTSNPASYTYISSPAVGSSLANGHTISFTGNLSRNAGEDIGLYAITRNTFNHQLQYQLCIQGFRNNESNYNSYSCCKMKTYGQVNPTLTGTFTGAILSDNITVTYSTTATQYSNVTLTGYPITATINDPNSRLFNYNVINTPNILTITKATPIFTITPYNAMYDGNQHSATGTAIGVDGSSLSGFIFTPAGYKDVPGGSQSWTFSGGTDSTNGSGNTTVTITPQTANPVGDAYYSGPSFYWTTSATTKTATLALAATIKNNMNYTGDVRTAKISFFIRSGTTLNTNKWCSEHSCWSC